MREQERKAEKTQEGFCAKSLSFKLFSALLKPQVAIALLLTMLLAFAVSAQIPTKVSLQGKVTDSGGSPIASGDLTVNISTSLGCTGSTFTKLYPNAISNGLFNILLGDTSSLDLVYNQDYYLCTIVNGQKVGTPQKFRGGQGEIGGEDIAPLNQSEITPPDRGSSDYKTLFLCHFDNDYVCEDGENATLISNTLFDENGRFGAGINVTGNDDNLTYLTQGNTTFGKNVSYVNLNTQQGTIEFWFKPSYDGSSTTHKLFYLAQNYDDIRIGLGANNQIGFNLWDNTSSYTYCNNSINWKKDEWHHVAMTWKNQSFLRGYVDGVEICSDTTNVVVPTYLRPTMYIGKYVSNPANGTLDEFRILDRPLTSEEIFTDYMQDEAFTDNYGDEHVDRSLIVGENLVVKGDAWISGTCQSQGADCASDIAELWHSQNSFNAMTNEYTMIMDDEEYTYYGEWHLPSGFQLEFESGDVVCADKSNSKRIAFCSESYDTSVLSVVNYNAKTILGQRAPYPLALAGNVPVKVKCTTPIAIGDLLVASSTPGYAQSVNTNPPTSWQQVWNHLGSPFAKALEPCSGGSAVIRAWLI